MVFIFDLKSFVFKINWNVFWYGFILVSVIFKFILNEKEFVKFLFIYIKCKILVFKIYLFFKKLFEVFSISLVIDGVFC